VNHISAVTLVDMFLNLLIFEVSSKISISWWVLLSVKDPSLWSFICLFLNLFLQTVSCFVLFCAAYQSIFVFIFVCLVFCLFACFCFYICLFVIFFFRFCCFVFIIFFNLFCFCCVLFCLLVCFFFTDILHHTILRLYNSYSLSDSSNISFFLQLVFYKR